MFFNNLMTITVVCRATPPFFRHTPHMFRGPAGSSTHGPSGAARFWATIPFRHSPQTCSGSTRAPPKAPAAQPAC
eukprot:9476032-Pyramimonas_sp.AAC.1